MRSNDKFKLPPLPSIILSTTSLLIFLIVFHRKRYRSIFYYHTESKTLNIGWHARTLLFCPDNPFCCCGQSRQENEMFNLKKRNSSIAESYERKATLPRLLKNDTRYFFLRLNSLNVFMRIFSAFFVCFSLF